jgi:intracellular multiplication protein IcmK
MYHTSEYAKASSAGTPPKPTATSQFVNLSPGSTPPVIRLSQGFVSSLVFLDSTGAPWPISAYDLGDPEAFNIQWDKTGNTLMIQASKLYNYGNLAVRLRGLNTPVMLTLIPGQKAVDYRVDLRVQGYGPNAKSLPTEEGSPPAANDILLHVLDGVPPEGSSRLVISGGDARAWLLNDKMFIRTGLTILSPGWIGSMTSADGTHAYEMQKSPVILVSWHGKVMQLKVEGL